MIRVGWGVDAHRFGGPGPLRLGGVVVSDRGLAGTSDADVLTHAIVDAVLGAVALGDIGSHFPSSDPQWTGQDSMYFLEVALAEAAGAGFVPGQLDATVIAESVRVSPHRAAIRASLAAALSLDVSAVSVKATTTDGMGFLGRDEGMAAVATVLMVSAG
jgi:2-C-methyl-D-erythritol 2,4-cyclodiphosphate synthase